MRVLMAVVMVLCGAVAGGCTVPLGASDPTTVTITPSTVQPATPPTFEAQPIDGPVGPGESGTVEVRVGDKDRSFLLHVPEGYSPHQTWPLIMAFHGYTEHAETLQRNTELDQAAALVVYAEGYEQAWAPAPYAETTMDEDIAYSEAIVAAVDELYEVDTDAIALTGFSNGGGFAAALACRMPERIAGVAAVSGAYYEDVHRDCVDTPVPHLEIHGTADPVIGYYGGTRHRTAYDSIDDVLRNVAVRNRCGEGVSLSRENLGTVNMRWRDCEEKLEHVRIGGGGHFWPGGARDDTTHLPQGYGTFRILRFFDIGWT